MITVTTDQNPSVSVTLTEDNMISVMLYNNTIVASVDAAESIANQILEVVNAYKAINNI